MSLPIFQPKYVGHFWDGKDWNFMPMTHRESDRALHFNYRVLETFNFPRRGGALVIACYDDWAMTMPLEDALIQHNQIIYNADESPFEANRIEMFIRRMNPAVVIGVSAGVLQGLTSMGHDPAQLFAGRTVWCRDFASYEQLRAAEGIALRHWRQIGPAAAMECVAGAGLHVDAEEWQLETQDGEILVTNRLDRFPKIVRQTTGLKGSIIHECCTCGLPHPRVVLDN